MNAIAIKANNSYQPKAITSHIKPKANRIQPKSNQNQLREYGNNAWSDPCSDLTIGHTFEEDDSILQRYMDAGCLDFAELLSRTNVRTTPTSFPFSKRGNLVTGFCQNNHNNAMVCTGEARKLTLQNTLNALSAERAVT